jgi:hypothetical protein
MFPSPLLSLALAHQFGGHANNLVPQVLFFIIYFHDWGIRHRQNKPHRLDLNGWPVPTSVAAG